MCGICGFTGIADPDGRLVHAMTERIHHRGPDSAGVFREGGTALGMRRLSIIDLATGKQPIGNEDDSLQIVYNGEIYNYQPLRAEMVEKGHLFRTQSDTEVILHLYEEYGPRCLERLNGMFAIAIFDRKRGELFLARDRLGVKPLYYAEVGGAFLFASEIKALAAWPGLALEVNPAALHDYLALRYVPGPGTMFRQVAKFPAAHWGRVRDGKLTLERWWTPHPAAGPFPKSDGEYLEEFASEFKRSVRMRLISEVPLGAYLSGGVDSGAIVATMAPMLDHRVRTFTVGFDFRHDELEAAARTARHLGAEHTEIACSADDIELLPRIAWHLDEPLGDPIVLPMFLLAREARRAVTVILAGEGADEILGGYLFHKVLLMAHRFARWVPAGVRRALVRPAVAAVPAGLLDMAFDYPADLGRRGKQKVLDFLNLMEPEQLGEAYRHLISLFDGREFAGLYSPGFASDLAQAGVIPPARAAANGEMPWLHRIIDLQFDHWLQDDILTKQDKLSMASSIEARVPFLDYQLVETALRLPPHLKIGRGGNKVALRRYAEPLLPAGAAGRGKQPFYVPMEQFLAHPRFREMEADTLSSETVRRRGVFDPAAVAAIRQRAAGGEFVYAKQVFSLVMLELWYRAAVDARFAGEGG